METTINTIGIYHKDCLDGTTAAAVLLTKFPKAQIFPLGHGFKKEELETIIKEVAPNSHIFTIDCALGVQEFLRKGFSVTTIDHHIGIEKEMTELAQENKNFTFIFNNDKSGASLTWSFFFPDTPAPELVGRVEDGDLWKWRHGDEEETRDIKNYLTLFLNEPRKLLPFLKDIPGKARENGNAISRFSEVLIQEFVQNSEPLSLSIGTYVIPAYNTPFFQSQIGAVLAEQHQKTVCLFHIKSDGVRMSFRGKKEDSPSALDLAKTLGGGGHIQAAGARVLLSDFLKMLTN